MSTPIPSTIAVTKADHGLTVIATAVFNGERLQAHGRHVHEAINQICHMLMLAGADGAAHMEIFDHTGQPRLHIRNIEERARAYSGVCPSCADGGMG